MSRGGSRREAEQSPHPPVLPPLPPGYNPVQILNGRAWVIVDAAVVDVSSFAKRHPGGARLIINCVGTDVTSEIIGEDASIANSGMFFAPHHHTDVSSAVGSEAGVVKRRIRMIGGGLGATLRTVDRLVPSRLYRAALWTFSSCHRSYVLARKCSDRPMEYS